MPALEAFCKRWQVKELALFGSALRDDFGPESDIDLLVTFEPDARPSLFDMAGMARELESIFEREVDLVSRRGIERSENWIRRREILSTARTIYAA
jgi:predicted nucleotidyltransferase